ncbi:ankyrin repeat domain-containing protein [Accumulibacter sp.]|uniref:DNA 3'-5' helicase II n=2 Tax=Candidatus Accumulibacter TaxID=327159 RepID=C7RVL2_ACCRE|nr:ankyrin repeat domain-containing protein [Accumulibacter sp.]MBN8498009.1 AAA family ATPase [Accumulibacter sp.]MBO3716441.1 AAA family ATPase [Accumulibacter sp.]
MKILEYTGLDTSRVKASYCKVADAIARHDFRAAQVKKLVNLSHGKFYRARLGDADRLLFSLVRHGDEVCALMLEVIANHDYDKSRFLRGAAIDESRIPDIGADEAIGEALPVRYLHPERTAIHLLDKPISFDDTQDAVYRQPPPLIVVGSAGSGKTALTLEKLKHAEGEVLYVTHSSYLAQSARDLYYANGFEHTAQEAVFLSYREFVESIRVPPGREATWRDFAGWFARMRQTFREFDGHQAFEEIRGVLAAGAAGVVSRADYLALGVRQSIFPVDLRDKLYDLFEKYRGWLAEARLYDLNLVAQDWQALAAPRYDFVVIDEVQDITTVQLALVLRTLKKPGHFLLCGDSNQIVHPNFFSWSQVKSLFWKDPKLAERQELRVLTANFRNGLEATRVANQLLKIKHRRFGSIDRESNFLVQAVGGDAGQVALLPDKDVTKRELDQKIRQSTQFAVLVMRDEDKVEARKHFATPLLFSIHEAKGLEYENIVLYRFVSDHRAEFGEIVDGVAAADLAVDTLDYRRAKDKSDKSLEVYKFFVNALYVALTRAIKNVYVIESDTGHPLFGLLELNLGQVKVEARQSTLEDWQKEARKLELQGKQEQAEAIRRTILKQTPVPWPVFGEERVTELLVKVFREQAPGAKMKQQLYEYATCHDEPQLAEWLASEARFEQAANFTQQRATFGRKTYVPYFANHFKDILKQCEQYGLEHRLPMNQTPLMAAAAAGNLPLVEALLDRGADRDAVDQYGYNALHWALREGFREAKFARGPLAALYERLAPASIDVNTGERLVRLDRHLSEYFLFQTLWVLCKSRFTHRQRRTNGAFEAQAILDAWQFLPANIVRPERNKRQHLSSVLARNEIDRDYAYNRALFKRVSQGWYQFNPKLAVRRRQGDEETWAPIFAALNLPLINEFSRLNDWGWPEPIPKIIDRFLLLTGLPGWRVPIAAERSVARARALEEERLVEARALQAQREAEQAAAAQRPVRWDGPQAKRLEIERIRREIEARKNR